MNVDVCVFGQNGSSCFQYPNDGTRDSVIKKILLFAKGKTQVVIHRDDDLMYYFYVRTIDKNQSVGYGVILNNSYFQSIEPLFNNFEKVFEYMVARGLFVYLSSKGAIAMYGKFGDIEKDAVEVCSYLYREFDSLENQTKKNLPAKDYAIKFGQDRRFAYGEDDKSIVQSSLEVDYVSVYKDVDIDSVGLKSSVAAIKSLEKKNAVLKESLRQKEEAYWKLSRKQKQTTVVAILAGTIVVVLCVVGIVLSSLHKERVLAECQQDTILMQKQNIGKLENDYGLEKQERIQYEGRWNEIVNNANAGFLVTNCILDTDSRMLTVYYQGLSHALSDSVSLQVYKSNGVRVFVKDTLVSSGLGCNRLYFSLEKVRGELQNHDYFLMRGNSIVGGLKGQRLRKKSMNTNLSSGGNNIVQDE